MISRKCWLLPPRVDRTVKDTIQPETEGTLEAMGENWDGGLALETITGFRRAANPLLAVIAERIRSAADHLRLSRDDLVRIFNRHTVYEGETDPLPGGPLLGFLIVETHHEIGGMVGKGALKMVFPGDLLGQAPCFHARSGGRVEVLPDKPGTRWRDASAPEGLIKQTMRELMAGESLSMSLKCQATGAPFAGSEGLVLCARRLFDVETGRYFLEPALGGTAEDAGADKELIEFMMNSTAEKLTLANRIGYDRIVHAAETNSTLTARLDLQLPTNVVEGHLRALLQSDAGLIIGDEDMTARLRWILSQPDYVPTRCALAKAAALMQMEHAVLLPASRERLRALLAELPPSGPPTPAQYRAVITLFFGAGETQQNESRLFYHREPILRALSVALSAHGLETCGDAGVLSLYLKTLLDNERIMLRALLLRGWPAGEALPLDWFERARLLTPAQEKELAALAPVGDLSKADVAERFRSIGRVLSEAFAGIPENPSVYRRAGRELLELAFGAIAATGEVLPPVERIVFFTLPFTYDCATPRLGVVTRKPAALCGSALRPTAMAAGAVKSIEILWKRLAWKEDAFDGMTVAIEGLGNAGKHLARMLAAKGAKIIAVSDSRGALVRPGGFASAELEAILHHKDAGKRFDTFTQGRDQAPDAGIAFYPDPGHLKTLAADLLVLTAFPASIDEDNAHHLQFKLVCELTGAAVTSPGKRILMDRHIRVIPDNLASSGGLLVSLSEMLQNSAAQVWSRAIEEQNLEDQLTRSSDAIITLAAHHNVDIPTASDILALRRMQELTRYRAQVQRVARALAHRIDLIRTGDHVLMVVDDDEDGAASAAILSQLFEALDAPVNGRVTVVSESFRTGAILDLVRESASLNKPIGHVFVLDRSYPLSAAGQRVLAQVAARCRVTIINNHDLSPELLHPPSHPTAAPGALPVKTPAELGVLLISPQTLHATVPSRQFPTALVLRELAQSLIGDPATLSRIDWQAAVGSWLDMPEEMPGQWLLFFAQFNPDKVIETARAIRTVTRAGRFQIAIDALIGVERPDQLETNPAWGRFVAEHRTLEDRVQLLVEKILLENRRQPVTIHFFTRDEVASPAVLAGHAPPELDLYQWISERLTRHGDLADKPIIVGQVIRSLRGDPYLGVRIRSPRGIDLMEAGLPDCFVTGGLPNTAVAKIPIPPAAAPRQLFDDLVDQIWMKTTGPFRPIMVPPAKHN